MCSDLLRKKTRHCSHEKERDSIFWPRRLGVNEEGMSRRQLLMWERVGGGWVVVKGFQLPSPSSSSLLLSLTASLT